MTHDSTLDTRPRRIEKGLLPDRFAKLLRGGRTGTTGYLSLSNLLRDSIERTLTQSREVLGGKENGPREKGGL